MAGVEVSFDGGNRWHPADGREEWQIAWQAPKAGTFTICCRAVDDSGNLEQSSSMVTIVVK